VPTNMKPYDFGLNAIAAIELNDWRLTASLSHGLTELLTNGNLYSGNYQNEVIGLSMTYVFSLKRR